MGFQLLLSILLGLFVLWLLVLPLVIVAIRALVLVAVWLCGITRRNQGNPDNT